MNKHIWRGTMILTAAALLVKILSAVYRLPYQNLAGDVGFYVYQQVYPFYALAVAMGGTSFPIIISKMMAEKSTETHSHSKRVLFMNGWYAVAILSFAGFIMLFAGAPLIAELMSDMRLVPSLRIVSFIYLFVPFLAVFRGYFQGHAYNMSPTAFSQVGEQSLRVGAIIGLALLLSYQGGTSYQFGEAAAFGSMIGPVASLSVLLLFFAKDRHGVEQSLWHMAPLDKHLILQMIKRGLAFTLLSLTLVSLQFIDSITMVTMLDHAHYDDPKALKGVYDRSYPLIQMGMSVALALTTAIVPVLAESSQIKNKAVFRNQIRIAMLLSFIFGAAASVGLFLIGSETNHMLFQDDDGSLSLMIMGLNILFVSLIVASAGIWHGTGEDWRAVKYLGVVILIKFAFNILLIPAAGITGGALSTVLATAAGAIINLYALRRTFEMRLMEWGKAFKLFAALFLMGGVIWGWKKLCYLVFGLEKSSRLQSSVLALTSVAIGTAVFLLLLFALNFFNDEERGLLPFQGFAKKRLGKSSWRG